MSAETGEIPHNLLIIDDERDILSALRRQFRKSYNIFIASSGEEGLEIMKEHSVQVIISDQRMPSMTGSAFFDQVKNEHPDATRLLLTGYADIQAVIEAVNDGNIYRYITKPWDPVELETIVREAFERHDLIIENKTLMSELQAANDELEARVEARTAELRVLNKEKDRMIGVVAHDLRGPLGTIKMCHEVMADESTPEESKPQFLELADQVVDKALGLVNDLLDVSAIETGSLVLEKESVELQPFLEKVVRLNRPVGESKGISLTLENKGSEEWKFDPERMEQVLDNLIGNAYKFSHKGTAVRLTVQENEGELVFACIDQGQGIREKDMGKLFTAFQKTSTQPTGSENSNGLGLSICKKIVEMHGGTLKATSTFGEGATFEVRLPK